MQYFFLVQNTTCVYFVCIFGPLPECTATIVTALKFALFLHFYFHRTIIICKYVVVFFFSHVPSCACVCTQLKMQNGKYLPDSVQSTYSGRPLRGIDIYMYVTRSGRNIFLYSARIARRQRALYCSPNVRAFL